jgi:hypothetical protein
MKQIEIHLSEPFEEVLATLFTLPSTLAEIGEVGFPEADDSKLRKSAKCVAEVEEALRSLYEAAHGRQVETPIGFLPIAPPVAGFLKKKPYYVATQHEFFLEALTRILAGDPRRKIRANGSSGPPSKRVINRREIDASRSHVRRESRSVLVCPTSQGFTSNQRITRP